MKNISPSSSFAALRAFLFFLLLAGSAVSMRGEAMLQLFNLSWTDVTKKMPEIAEAGYDALWLPPPAKGSSVYSIGYDLHDPFDLGDLNQSGTTATHWGTKAQLQEMVRTAHRFGIRVYFDNIMNHRAFTVPGYNNSTPTNFYPGLQPKDFHLQTSGNNFVNWPSVQDWNNQFDVQYQSLGGLIDLATEPGSVNGNFGATSGSTTTKPNFIRHPGQNQFYMDATKPAIEGSPWHPFNDTNGTPVAEDVNSYTIRAALYTLDQTKCDGFRLDAVKHVPSGFFGTDTGGSTFANDPSFAGYTGAIQAMYDYVHGYGTNVLGNGYTEADGNRNSCFDTETTRNDAMLFGEHLGAPPTYAEYLARGMRLLNSPLRDQMNSALQGYSSLAGMDGRDYAPGGGFTPVQSVMFAQSHDASGSYAAHRELQNAYYFMHEGATVIYSDGYNFSGAPNYFPSLAYANYLGEYGENQMPDICYVHNQLARGGTSTRWSDQNIAAFERYDYREGGAAKDQVCVLFAMNDKYTFPGDITFDDGIGQSYDGYYGGIAISNSKGQGLAVGFPPGSVLVQLSSSATGNVRAYQKLLVHSATTSSAAATASINAANAADRLIYVGSQTIPTGGGAIELNVPSGGWVTYGYQWPEASRANVSTNAIIFKQGSNEVPHITITRTDGVNGDTNGYNPIFPFKMRGSVDQYGNVIGGVHVSNLTYAIDIPVVTNGNFDILARCDASSVNTLLKLDGGIDLNSQMTLGPTSGGVGPTGNDLRDNKPGTATDVFLGYEQTAFQFRNGPEKFAAKNTLSNTVVSLGAETYYYTVGGGSNIVAGSGYGVSIVNQTAAFVYHDPAATNTAVPANNSATQRVPFAPTNNQACDLFVKVGYQFNINTCFIYYTTDGSNPEGAFGVGKGSTKVVQGFFIAADSSTGTIDWWKGTIPAQPNATQVRYKIALFKSGINTIADGESTGSKLYGLSQFAVTNFNPSTAVVWQHNDLNTNSTAIGLSSGFHIVRARTFLPRTNQSSSFNTFLQTFYYDGALPTGAIAFPANGSTIGALTYTVVVRADSTVTGADFQIQDSDPNNDDSITGKTNGNSTNVFVVANAVSPDAGISATYPNYPQEFRFVYTNIPTSGTAKIIVRLKEFASTVYPNRVTLLTNTVTTLAPVQIVSIASPATNGAVLTYNSNMVYLVQACFTGTLTANRTNFNIFINGVLQPPTNYFFQPVGGNNAYCPGLRTIQYNWNNPPLGTNLIQVIYTNAITPISDTRTVTVAPPLRISGLDNNNQQVVWDSAPGINYQVYATTNLLVPFAAISDPIQASGSSTFYYDPNPAAQKFYQVVQLP